MSFNLSLGKWVGVFQVETGRKGHCRQRKEICTSKTQKRAHHPQGDKTGMPIKAVDIIMLYSSSKVDILEQLVVSHTHPDTRTSHFCLRTFFSFVADSGPQCHHWHWGSTIYGLFGRSFLWQQPGLPATWFSSPPTCPLSMTPCFWANFGEVLEST